MLRFEHSETPPEHAMLFVKSAYAHNGDAYQSEKGGQMSIGQTVVPYTAFHEAFQAWCQAWKI
jgi:hypothetical protein